MLGRLQRIEITISYCIDQNKIMCRLVVFRETVLVGWDMVWFANLKNKEEVGSYKRANLGSKLRDKNVCLLACLEHCIVFLVTYIL